jgi:D-alanine-D-alanine ligase
MQVDRPQQARDLGKVAVLMGGMSAEREISLMSGNGVLAALRAQGVDAHAFDPAERPLSDLKSEGFARCFIALHGRFGEDGTVQGALELLGIPYTGSGVMASSMSIDKVMTKRVWLADGLSTPRYVLLRRGVYTATDVAGVPAALGLPLIVKPAREGSSIGLTKVTQDGQMAEAVAQAGQLDADILCEQFISGDEVTCPVLGTGADARALPVIRIVAPEGNYDYQNKYFTDTTQYLVPCGLPDGEEEAIQQLVLAAYRTLNCRGWARADVMIDAATRKPYLLEINTSPGMTSHSLVPMSARAAGMSYEALCLRVLQSAALDYPAPASADTTAGVSL